MINRRIVATTASLLVAFGFFAAAAQATLVTQALGDSGWAVRYDDAGITITHLNPPSDPSDTLVVQIEKVAQFTEGLNQFGSFDPAEITFMQTSAEAVGTIAIDREHVFNNTGLNWDGFRMIIEDPMQGVGTGTHFDQAASASLDVSPFTSKQFISDATTEELKISGGTVADGDEWTPGFGNGGSDDGGALFINTDPFTSGMAHRVFVLKEQPTEGGVVIPLPAAAWSGITGLIGLGLARGLKAARRSRTVA